MNQGLEIINCTYSFLKNEKKINNFNCKFLPINCNNCKFRTNHSSSIMAFAVSTDHNSELAKRNPKFEHMNYLLMAYYIIHIEHKLSPNGTLTECNNGYTAN